MLNRIVEKIKTWWRNNSGYVLILLLAIIISLIASFVFLGIQVIMGAKVSYWQAYVPTFALVTAFVWILFEYSEKY